MKTKVIDRIGLFPQAVMQESNDAFVLHEFVIYNEALKDCFRHGVSPFIAPKAIGCWANDRYIWSRCVLPASMLIFKSHIEGLTYFSGVQKAAADGIVDADDKIPDVIRNIDFRDLMINRCGFSEEEYKDMSKFLDSAVEAIESDDHAAASRIVAKMMIAREYMVALCGHDNTPQNPYAGNHDGHLNSSPTIDDLDKWIANHPAYDPIWNGDCNFFGWDGQPESLNDITVDPTTLTEEDHPMMYESGSGSCKVLPTGCYKLGRVGSHHNLLAVIAGFDCPMQRYYREMNWHLDEEAFNESPYFDHDNKAESYMFNTKEHLNATGYDQSKLWIGNNPKTRYLKAEGMDMDTRFLGAIMLSDTFAEESSVCAEHSKIYAANEPHRAAMWVSALSSLASRMMSSYGPTGASILNHLQVGYVAIPLAAIEPNNDGQSFDEKMNEINESGLTPFVLEPVYSSKMLREVTTKGEVRDAFLKLMQHMHMPNASMDTVTTESNRAIKKLMTLYERAEKNNWLDKIANEKDSGVVGIATISTEKEGGKLSKDEQKMTTFLDALDMFADEYHGHFIGHAENFAKHGTIFP